MPFPFLSKAHAQKRTIRKFKKKKSDCDFCLISFSRLFFFLSGFVQFTYFFLPPFIHTPILTNKNPAGPLWFFFKGGGEEEGKRLHSFTYHVQVSLKKEIIKKPNFYTFWYLKCFLYLLQFFWSFIHTNVYVWICIFEYFSYTCIYIYISK